MGFGACDAIVLGTRRLKTRGGKRHHLSYVGGNRLGRRGVIALSSNCVGNNRPKFMLDYSSSDWAALEAWRILAQDAVITRAVLVSLSSRVSRLSGQRASRFCCSILGKSLKCASLPSSYWIEQ